MVLLPCLQKETGEIRVFFYFRGRIYEMPPMQENGGDQDTLASVTKNAPHKMRGCYLLSQSAIFILKKGLDKIFIMVYNKSIRYI